MEAFNIMKAKFFSMVLAVVLMSTGISFGQAVSLDNITGTMWHGQADSMMAGSTYVFNLRFTNGATAQDGIANGFRVYSDDGATWTTTVGDSTAALGGAQFDLVYTINNFSITGSGADTVGLGGAKFLAGSGLVAGYDSVAFTITIGPIPTGAAQHGKTICLDSAFFPPSGAWKWAAGGGVDAFPTWDGPHCYTVVDEATDFNPTNGSLPTSFGLAQNYPNPFNPSTVIDFSLPTRSDVTLTIYNVTGQKVKEISGSYAAGINSISWDASANSSGIYFYKLVAGDFSDTKKMMLLK